MEGFPAPSRSLDPMVLIVPFFGGTSAHLKRHIKFVNDLGFDASLVNLTVPHLRDPRPPISRRGQIGLKYVWADRIEDDLRDLGRRFPDRPVIVYAFSGPAAAAFAAIARLRQADARHSPKLLRKAGEFLWGKSQVNTNAPRVLGIVCDSGPFVDLWRCNWKYMYHSFGLKFLPLRGAATAASILIWGYDAEATLHEDLRTTGRGLPILSIRGWNDKLISVDAIDAAFPRDADLDLKVLSIPQAGHLDGLKSSPETYVPRVESFLKSL